MNFDSRDLERLNELFTSDGKVLLSTHIRPDPDAIGSVLAVREALANAGVEPFVILEDPCPPRCRFLSGADRILRFCDSRGNLKKGAFGRVIIVDSGDRARIGEVEYLIAENAEIVNVDHHGSNKHFGALNFVYPETAACGELLYYLFKSLGVPITPGMAANLYAGILTDTGRFRHSNTTAQSLRVAAALIEAGADASEITDRLYFSISTQDVRLMGSVLAGLELHGSGRISMVLVPLDHAIEDSDHIVDFARAVEGVEIAAMLSEMPDGKIRVSLRSKSHVDASRLAESLGGGGHLRAAGFRMRGSLESVRERILPVLLAAVESAVEPSN